jgi:hypothetical protein
MTPIGRRLAASISLIVIFCSFPTIMSWNCKGCSSLHCKPSGSCFASDGEMQPSAVSWFFYNDLIVQQSWTACGPSSCPLIELPCGHSHYSGTYTLAKYDVAISCELNSMQCVVGRPLPNRFSSSLSRVLQLSLTSGNSWIQVAGNSSCGSVDDQLRCSGNGRLWIRGGIYTGPEEAWVGTASFRCVSCDSAMAAWLPTGQAPLSPSHDTSEAIGHEYVSSSYQTANATTNLASEAHDNEGGGGRSPAICLPLSACLTVGHSASGMLLAVSTACIEEDCQRYLLVSSSSSNSPLASHVFSFVSIQRAVVERHSAQLQFLMRSGPALTLQMPLSSCSFSHHLLLELQQHSVLFDDFVASAFNSSCTSRSFPVLRGDSICVSAIDAAAAHHMASSWHEHVLHLQVVSGSHISQEDAEAKQLKLQMQARDSLCADEVDCDITCLSCDGAFIATTHSRIVVAMLPIDKSTRVHLLSRVVSVETLGDGSLRLFFVRDEFPDAVQPHVSYCPLISPTRSMRFGMARL